MNKDVDIRRKKYSNNAAVAKLSEYIFMKAEVNGRVKPARYREKERK
jgi:hypothetical protein